MSGHAAVLGQAQWDALSGDDPTNIYTPFAWWRSDALTESGGLVSSWTDQSGNGHHVTEATVKPTYVASDGDWGGLPTVSFDGTTRLRSPEAASVWKPLHDGTTDYVFWWVGSTLDPGVANALMVSTGNASTVAGMYLRYTQSSTNMTLALNNAGGGSGMALSGVAVAFGSRLIYTARVTIATPHVRVSKNGLHVASSNTTGTHSASDPQQTMQLGATNSSPTAFFKGKFVETGFAFDADSHKFARLQAYLMLRYGAYLS